MNVGTSCLRGFDIRLQYAQAKIRSLSDPKLGTVLVYVALVAASDLGYDEADGDQMAPIMFEDEPHLRRAWNDGYWSKHLYTALKNSPD